jgi:hypothetical protein
VHRDVGEGLTRLLWSSFVSTRLIANMNTT